MPVSASTETKIAEAYAEVDAVTAEIAEKTGEIERLYERRRLAFIQLRKLGVAQAAIARHCGLSPMAVAFSLNGTKERKRKKS